MNQLPASSSIAGAVLPLGRAEELIATLQSVVSVRIVAGETGVIDAIHVLVTGDLTPKQVVRNVESALMAQLGMKVDHRKVSVATTSARPSPPEGIPLSMNATLNAPATATAPASVPPSAIASAPSSAPFSAPSNVPIGKGTATGGSFKPEVVTQGTVGRHLYFEDVEVRGSRTKGSTCKVTLRRGDSSWIGEAEGIESSRTRPELAARAALTAIKNFEGSYRLWELIGVKRVEAFDTEFMFVGVETWIGRHRTLLTGSCEIRESAETSAVLAVLDATNRWLGQQND